MTFEQFVASEKTETVEAFLARIGLHPEETNLEGSTGVRTYGPDNLYYIGVEADGRFSLILGNCDWLTTDLQELQRLLFNWAAGEEGWQEV
jgi:hypothetical protein